MSESEVRVHFRVARFIFESGLKLHLGSVPLATAATIYHKFFRQNQLQEYDPFLIGSTCLYLACKIDEESVRLRDVVNVCYRTLHKNKAPLEIGDVYWALRESVARCELYLLRALQFRVEFDHPHKYLCHYLRALSNWMEPSQWQETPIARAAWSFLQDSYHLDMCLDHPPQDMAVSVLYLAFLCYGLEVPHSKQADKKWWQVFSPYMTLKDIQTIITKIMNIYQVETSLPR